MSTTSLFFHQNLFQTLLCLERKRSERTGGSFVFALLDVSRLGDSKKVESICEGLRQETRETDITGWYDQPTQLGAIFTTLNGAERSLIRTRLKSKIDNALARLDPAERKCVDITLYFFPDETPETIYPDLTNGSSKRSFHVLKRVVDIACSLCALTAFAPVFLLIAVLVKYSSPGPVLFRQKRLGKFGREFDFLKFRTMITGNDPRIHQEYVKKLILQQQDSSGVFKIKNDPRVTQIGSFLRKTSLDELPQFLNVLRGEMSLVGPRPPIPYELENYRCWHRRRVIEVKPGITGLWQVEGRSRTTFEEMVRLDLRYIRNQSVWLDTKIFLKTPLAVITGSGAY
jgi:lipopolysaccharide/colanic/teichoic acid biosynthesis glycosyltransferase